VFTRRDHVVWHVTTAALGLGVCPTALQAGTASERSNGACGGASLHQAPAADVKPQSREVTLGVRGVRAFDIQQQVVQLLFVFSERVLLLVSFCWF